VLNKELIEELRKYPEDVEIFNSKAKPMSKVKSYNYYETIKKLVLE